jgi:hypothetical protein
MDVNQAVRKTDHTPFPLTSILSLGERRTLTTFLGFRTR